MQGHTCCPGHSLPPPPRAAHSPSGRRTSQKAPVTPELASLRPLGLTGDAGDAQHMCIAHGELVHNRARLVGVDDDHLAGGQGAGEDPHPAGHGVRFWELLRLGGRARAGRAGRAGTCTPSSRTQILGSNVPCARDGLTAQGETVPCTPLGIWEPPQLRAAEGSSLLPETTPSCTLS